MDAVGALMGQHMGAERAPQAVMGALADEVLVDLAENGAEAVGIVLLPFRAVTGEAEAVGEAGLPPGRAAREEAFGAFDGVEGGDAPAGSGVGRLSGLGAGGEGADRPDAVDLVGAQYREGVARPALDDGARGACIDQFGRVPRFPVMAATVRDGAPSL
jgi:hypothetical protein